MTINQTSLEYHRQLEQIRANNLQGQKNANKAILIFAGTMLLFITTCFILNYFNIIHLS